MKKMKTAREVALDVLTKVEKEHSYSNLQLNQSLKTATLSRKDVQFATEIIYGTIQRLNTIDWILHPFVKTKLDKMDTWVKNLLRLSIYQIWYLDRVPAHAVVNEAVNIAKKKGHKGIVGMVNGVLRNILRQKDSISLPEHINDTKRISLEHSHPEWLVKRFIQEYGEGEAKEICRANNLPPYHTVRVNPLRITREEMISLLKKELDEEAEIIPSPLSKQGIRIKGGGNLAFSSWYKDGYITIQDESSMLVAEVLNPKEDMLVLDAAAAPGGKTTHIAELMKDKGKVIAADIHKHKIKLIEEQQERLHLHIIEAIHADARKIKDYTDQRFDRILLDVPCSGLGVIRRKPDVKWTKSEDDIREITKIQEEILEEVFPLLKPDGVLVYSTCTMTLEENQKMVERFLEKHDDFYLDQQLPNYLSETVNEKVDARTGMLQILPQHFHSDGFFISRLLRNK